MKPTRNPSGNELLPVLDSKIGWLMVFLLVICALIRILQGISQGLFVFMGADFLAFYSAAKILVRDSYAGIFESVKLANEELSVFEQFSDLTPPYTYLPVLYPLPAILPFVLFVQLDPSSGFILYSCISFGVIFAVSYYLYDLYKIHNPFLLSLLSSLSMPSFDTSYYGNLGFAILSCVVLLARFGSGVNDIAFGLVIGLLSAKISYGFFLLPLFFRRASLRTLFGFLIGGGFIWIPTVLSLSKQEFISVSLIATDMRNSKLAAELGTWPQYQPTLWAIFLWTGRAVSTKLQGTIISLVVLLGSCLAYATRKSTSIVADPYLIAMLSTSSALFSPHSHFHAMLPIVVIAPILVSYGILDSSKYFLLLLLPQFTVSAAIALLPDFDHYVFAVAFTFILLVAIYWNLLAYLVSKQPGCNLLPMTRSGSIR